MVNIYEQFKNVIELEILYADGEKIPQKLSCNVSAIKGKKIYLTSENSSAAAKKIKVGNEIRIWLYSETGVYTAESKILSVFRGENSNEYLIEPPINTRHSQRREFLRAELPIKYRLKVYYDKEFKNSTLIEGNARNISGRGMSFTSDSMIIDYTALEVEFLFDEQTLKLDAEMVYSKKINVKNKEVFVHALTFKHISKKNTEFLVKKCFLYQLNQKKMSDLTLS